jgi:YVTN family beta-propeller protein
MWNMLSNQALAALNQRATAPSAMQQQKAMVQLPKIYVANSGSNTVSVINGTTNKVVATNPVGHLPTSITIACLDEEGCPNLKQ